MAPLDVDDLRIVLTVSRDSRAREWAPIIGAEFDRVRAFRRALGKRIRSRFGGIARSEPPKDRLDMEIDELLDQVSLLEVVALKEAA